MCPPGVASMDPTGPRGRSRVHKNQNVRKPGQKCDVPLLLTATSSSLELETNAEVDNLFTGFSRTFPVVFGQTAATPMHISKDNLLLLLFTPAGKFNPIINLFSLKESLVWNTGSRLL